MVQANHRNLIDIMPSHARIGSTIPKDRVIDALVDDRLQYLLSK